MRIDDLKEKLLKLANIASTIALVSWDQQVNMPERGMEYRGNQLAFLEGLYHQIYTGSDFSNTLAEFIDIKTGKLTNQDLSDLDKRMIYEVWRDWRQAILLPAEFVEKFAKLSADSYTIWEKAKKTNDYDSFEAIFDEVIQMSKQKAELINPEVSRYDALVDRFEPYMTSNELDSLFAELKVEVITLLNKIKSSKKEIKSFEGLTWKKDAQLTFIDYILKELGYDFSCGRQDFSEHPFSTSFHPTDCRITTAIRENDVMYGISASIHECGHALYEQGMDAKWFGTPIATGSSFGIHESQSRFYETRLGMSKNFWNRNFPVLKSHFSSNLKDISALEFYEAINRVNPGEIRLEADELTYNLHIIIRFELEKMIMNGNISAKEIPELWNARYEQYLGVSPENNARGVMQDVHWSQGYFGYFPSYVLGCIYASQMYETMLEEIPDLESKIASGDYIVIKKWLNKNVHVKGRSRTPKELIEEITGKTLSIKPYVNYLTEKFSQIYELRNNS